MELTRREGDLAEPGSVAWAAATNETVRLAPVPLDAQPTEYIRTSWAGRPYGRVGEVSVATAHDGERAYVRLEWADSEEPNTEFHDAAAVYFPAGDAGDAGDADDAATLGSPEGPVRVAYWQANLPAAKALLSTGPGRVAPTDGHRAEATASLDGGRWSVVLAVGLADAGPGRLGVAVWDGSNDERAGIGAATPEWIPLDITN